MSLLLRIRLFVVLLALFGPVSAHAAGAGPVDLYVFAGQSNMRGHVSTLSREAFGPALIPSPYREIYAGPVDWARQWNSGQQIPATMDATSGALGGKFVPFRAGYDPRNAKAGPWGPEVAYLYNRYVNDPRPIHFVKYAIGGTTVYLTPTKISWNAAAPGLFSLADALSTRVQRATDALLLEGYDSVNIHLVWAQGESDGGSMGLTYRQNFAGFYAYFTNRVARPNVTVTLDSMTLVQNAGSRNAQARINMAATDHGIQLVNVHDYPITLFISDNLHLGPAGQIRHGTEMEEVGRTKPRLTLDNTATEITSITVKIPLKPAPIAYLTSSANGSYGFEMSGDVTGLTLDPLLGKLAISDPSQIIPGLRSIVVTRHSVPDVRKTTLRITFVR